MQGHCGIYTTIYVLRIIVLEACRLICKSLNSHIVVHVLHVGTYPWPGTD